MATNGLVVMTPSSVAKTGGSSTATINADGSVTFGACETLSLNGVFTSDYDNYMVTMRIDVSSGANDVNVRLRASGVDASASNYTYQYLNADNTTVNAGRGTTTSALFAFMSGAGKQGATGYVFGPYLAQPTAFRSVTASNSFGSIMVGDRANTHSLSLAYDGLTFIRTGSAAFTGLVTVFGFNQ